MYGQNMKNNEIRDQRLELRLSKKEKDKIESLANRLELPVGTLIRNLVLVSYEDAAIFEKIGLLKGAKKILDFKEKFTILIKEIKYELER